VEYLLGQYEFDKKPVISNHLKLKNFSVELSVTTLLYIPPHGTDIYLTHLTYSFNGCVYHKQTP